MLISIIIPTLNEEASIAKTLKPLQAWRKRGHQVILVDANSSDNTVSKSKALVDICVLSTKGRANQMNEGAKHAKGDVLLFLHADTVINEDDDRAILSSVENYQWGRFRVRFSSDRFIFKIIALMMNMRSCITSIATGDQAIYVKKQLFDEQGGYPNLALMEDIQLSKQLNKNGRLCCLKNEVITSSRRWEQYGIARTIILMWGLRLAFFLGVSPEKLKKWYR